MATINEADYVCPLNESLDKFANLGIQRLRKDDLWSIAAQRPLHDREDFVAAADQYNAICASGGSFDTVNVRSQRVSTKLLQVDPTEFWMVPNFRYQVGWLPPSYVWGGQKYVPKLLIRPIQEIDTPKVSLGPHHHGFQCPLWIAYRLEQSPATLNCCKGKAGQFLELANNWTTMSSLPEFLQTEFIDQPILRRIDKIVCFGLGTLTTEWSFCMHVAANTLAQLLAKKQDAKPTLEVCDEGYCDASKRILDKFFNFKFYSRLDTLLRVDENTMVISLHPKEAISQFAMDICHDQGGPAALLSRGVFNDGRCIVQSAEGDHTSGIGNDYSSPLLYKWVNECKEGGRHVSLEDRFQDGEVHDELATFGQEGAELYWSK